MPDGETPAASAPKELVLIALHHSRSAVKIRDDERASEVFCKGTAGQASSRRTADLR
jgi:hypothetical protein